MCSKLVTVQYVPGYNIIFNTCKIQYLTKCIETTTNATYFITYQGTREQQKWTPYALINVQFNATDISWWQWNVCIKKVTFVFSLSYSLAVRHISCYCQCHKRTLHTVSKVCTHETDCLLLSSVLKARC